MVDLLVKNLHDLQDKSAKRAIRNLKIIRITKKINAILKDVQSSRLERTS